MQSNGHEDYLRARAKWVLTNHHLEHTPWKEVTNLTQLDSTNDTVCQSVCRVRLPECFADGDPHQINESVIVKPSGVKQNVDVPIS